MTPLFLGEVVRTYSWIVVLGNSGFVNSVLLKLHIIDHPLVWLSTDTAIISAMTTHSPLALAAGVYAAHARWDGRQAEAVAADLGGGGLRAPGRRSPPDAPPASLTRAAGCV